MTLSRKRMLLAALLLAAAAAETMAGEPDVLRYTARIRFDLSAQRLYGEATLLAINPGDTLHLHLRDLAVTGIIQDGQALAFEHEQGGLSIFLDAGGRNSDTVEVTISYNGKATSEAGSSSWGGCFWGPTTFAMGVGFHAPYISMTRHWLPSNDVPDDKATFDLTFIVPQGMTAAGSGLLAGRTDSSGWTSWRWIEGHQTATYLVTYAISGYAIIRGEWNGIQLEYYVPAADSAKGVAHFASVPSMLEAFTSAYGPYPFDKVGYCITPIGSMEHQTMISYAASLLRPQVAGLTAAHELAHQWWGDCVTARTFADAWLSEGFATFSEAVYMEHLGGRAAYEDRARQFASDYLNRVAPYEGIFPLHDYPRASPSSNYPGTIYDKGAAVLTMLRHMLGDDTFFAGLRAYKNARAYGTADTEDFRSAMEAQSGIDLGWFFDQWVYLPGYPIYVSQKIAAGGSGPFRIRLLQTQDTSRFPLFRMPLDVFIALESGDTLRTSIFTEAAAQQEFVFPSVPANSVRWYSLDPSNLVLKKISYTTVKAETEPDAGTSGFRLHPAYPNPFHSSGASGASVLLESGSNAHIRIDLHDSLGRLLAVCADSEFPPGLNPVSIPLNGLPSGIYTIRATGTERYEVRRILVSR